LGCNGGDINTYSLKIASKGFIIGKKDSSEAQEVQNAEVEEGV
jgi:hypothetical protein